MAINGGSVFQSLRETNTGIVFAVYLLRGALRKFQRGDWNLVPMPFIHIHPQSSELMSFAPSFSVLWDWYLEGFSCTFANVNAGDIPYMDGMVYEIQMIYRHRARIIQDLIICDPTFEMLNMVILWLNVWFKVLGFRYCMYIYIYYNYIYIYWIDSPFFWYTFRWFSNSSHVAYEHISILTIL